MIARLLVFARRLLVVWLGRRLRAGRHPDTQACRTAVHEAGHAVAAWYCSTVEAVTAARIDAAGGCVRLKFAGRNDDVQWGQVVIALSGLAAEMMVYRHTGSAKYSRRDDIRDAHASVRKIAAADHAAWKRCAETLPWQRAFTEPLDARTSVALDNAYLLARRLLSAHERRFYHLVALLLTHGSVSEREIAAVLGNRAFIRFAAVFGKTHFFGAQGFTAEPEPVDEESRSHQRKAKHPDPVPRPGGDRAPARRGNTPPIYALEQLGLRHGATREDVQRAYRARANRGHADHGGSEDMGKLVELRDAALREIGA